MWGGGFLIFSRKKKIPLSSQSSFSRNRGKCAAEKKSGVQFVNAYLLEWGWKQREGEESKIAPQYIPRVGAYRRDQCRIKVTGSSLSFSLVISEWKPVAAMPRSSSAVSPWGIGAEKKRKEAPVRTKRTKKKTEKERRNKRRGKRKESVWRKNCNGSVFKIHSSRKAGFPRCVVTEKRGGKKWIIRPIIAPLILFFFPQL